MNGYYKANNFVNNVYKNLKKLNNNEYFLQKNTVKQLKEEKLPLACFVKKFDRPGLEVKCKHILGSQNYDAKLKLFGAFVDDGVYDSEYYIEITTAVFHNEYKERIGLAKNGFYSDNQVHDTNEPITEMIEQIQVVIDKKNKKKYPKNTILLVNLISSIPLTLKTWESIRNQIIVDKTFFLNILIIDPYQNIVLEVLGKSQIKMQSLG